MSASVLIPKFKYYARLVTIDGTNDRIDFREDGVSAYAVAEIEHGTWSYGQLAYKVKQELEAHGASTYTVRYVYSTKKFTITSDGTGGTGLFQILAATSTAFTPLGYSGNKTGALTYTSDTAVPSQTTLTMTQNLERPLTFAASDREDFTLPSGRTESISFGTRDEYRFSVSHESVAVAQGVYDMVRDAVDHGQLIDFYPDSTSASYVQVKFLDRDIDIREMTGERLYRLYAFNFTVRVDPDSAGALTLRDLIDRLPSS